MNTNTKTSIKNGSHKQDTHYDGQKRRGDSVLRFVPVLNRKGEPSITRFENLRPGSYFGIFAEPSRRIRHSTDSRIYQKSFDQFNAHHVSSTLGIVLMPNDLVMIHKLAPLDHE